MIFLIGHCLMILLYSLPYQLVPARLQIFSSYYVSPFFEQGWSLFVPCPVHNNSFEVNYYFENDSSGWIDPFKQDHDLHQKIRFSHHSDIVLGESNALHYLMYDLENMGVDIYAHLPYVEPDGMYLSPSNSYWIARSYLYGACERLFDKSPVSASVRCHFNNVETGKCGVVELPRYEWKKRTP